MMDIFTSQINLFDQNKSVLFEKECIDGVFVFGSIFIFSDKFVEYQKDIFLDFLGKISDKIQNQPDIDLSSLKKFFEKSLQDLNTKLGIFADRIKDVEKFQINGIVQIFFHDSYISSMIGDVSIILIKDKKINYIIDNQINEDQKISIFSDIVEGDIENQDKIVFVATNILNIFDKDDLQNCLDLSINEDRDFIEVLKELGKTRVDEQDLIYISSYFVQKPILVSKTSTKEKIFKNIIYLNNLKQYIYSFRYPIVIFFVVLLVLYLLWSIISNRFGSSNISNSGGTVVIDFTPEDLKKELDIFMKLDPSSSDKITKYNEIMEKVKILEQKHKWANDVKEIKDILNKEYYRGFNIVLFNDFEGSLVYKFDDTEKNILGDIVGINYSNSNGLMVAGSKGAIFGMLNSNMKGKSFEYNIPTEVSYCAPNLLSDVMYCYSSGGNIFNLTKAGLQSITNKTGKFSNDISYIGSYNKANFYTFLGPNSYIADKNFIVRYSNILGSQTQFNEGMRYYFDDSFLNQNKDVLQMGFSSVFVDGTFLAWSKSKALYQFRRDGTTNILKGRKINLQGGATIGSGFSDDVKVMAEINGKFIYLFDKADNSLTVYSTSPYKNNTSYTTSYNAIYAFKIIFDFQNTKVKDVFIQQTDKKYMYIVTENGIYKINLYEYEENLKKKKE